MESFDVIIIGAGPSGLKCAETLGPSNLKVLILEKNKKIGPKVCAGGIDEKTVKYLNLPNKLIDFQYNHIKLHINKNYSLIKHNRNFIYTIDRKKLGQWQLRKLRKFKNIAIRTNSLVKKIAKNYVLIDNKKIKYKILVGADGSNSIVRKYLNISIKDIGLALQYIIKNKKYEDFEIFFNPKLFCSGYAWIFPHKNYTSIGCGFIPNKSQGNLLSNFKLWLKQNNIDISNAKYEAFPYNHDYKGHRFENIFLVGDAAGFLSSFTGEGIYQALISGEEIAKTILDKNYESGVLNDLLITKKKHDKILNLLNKTGEFRVVLLNIGRILLKISYFRKKAIEILA